VKQTAWFYDNGVWSEREDLVAAQVRDDEDEETVLRRLGYDRQHEVGDWSASSPSLQVWLRRERPPRQILIVFGEVGYERVYVDRLPDVWDLLARWVPVVRDTEIMKVLEDLAGIEGGPLGTVEMIARRAAFGATQPYERP
jgi:hypothetical protein